MSENERYVSVEEAWEEEVERRIAEIDAGEVEMIPWEQVRAELLRDSLP